MFYYKYELDNYGKKNCFFNKQTHMYMKCLAIRESENVFGLDYLVKNSSLLAIEPPGWKRVIGNYIVVRNAPFNTIEKIDIFEYYINTIKNIAITFIYRIKRKKIFGY